MSGKGQPLQGQPAGRGGTRRGSTSRLYSKRAAASRTSGPDARRPLASPFGARRPKGTGRRSWYDHVMNKPAFAALAALLLPVLAAAQDGGTWSRIEGQHSRIAE